jgi:hypothetical protein
MTGNAVAVSSYFMTGVVFILVSIPLLFGRIGPNRFYGVRIRRLAQCELTDRSLELFRHVQSARPKDLTPSKGRKVRRIAAADRGMK